MRYILIALNSITVFVTLITIGAANRTNTTSDRLAEKKNFLRQ